MIDMDPQGNMSSCLGIAEPDSLKVTIVNILEKIMNDEAWEPEEGLQHQEEGIDILPSEKAWAYRIKQEALNHQGIKNGQISADMVGDAAGDSRRTVYRYIRLTYLIESLLKWVDEGRITIAAGEQLSGLPKKEQELLADVIRETERFPSKETAGGIIKASTETGLTRELLLRILGGKQQGRGSGITLSAQRIRGYFPEGYTRKQIEEVIYQLLDSWKAGIG